MKNINLEDSEIKFETALIKMASKKSEPLEIKILNRKPQD